MSEYHYHYSQGGGGRNRQNGNGGGLIEMLVDILLSVIVAIPSLIATVVGKLTDATSQTGGTDGQTRAVSDYIYHKQAAPGSAGGPSSNLHQVQRPQAASGSPQREKKPDKEREHSVRVTAGRGLLILGSILAGFCGLSFLILLAEGDALSSLVATAACTALGLLTLGFGLRRRRKARLYLRYLGLIGRRESVNLTTLAQAAGRSHKKVCREVQEMLDRGILPAGYLDLAGDKLVLSAQGIADRPAQEAVSDKDPEDENHILRQIKEINDAIPDPVMSAKIDRIGEITGNILDYQRKNPDRASQLRSFLNYYLPTTLKILQAYAQLDRQGVEGENISAAKQRIEGMMDKVVEGFETQLDRLFQDDALDIASDVAVLEQMLEKDGLGQEGTPFAQ